MKERLLFTGGNGFIGRNLIPDLSDIFTVFSPRREELNLFCDDSIRDYLLTNKINYIIHSANPNPSKNPLDISERLLRDSLQMFMAIYQCKDCVKKIVYLGSGAIYDKTKDIISVSEEVMLRSVPKDDYGFAKYIMEHMTSENIYNLCLFGCYGPGDADSKFITHCIRCCLKHEPITIRQDCMFDYMHVSDLGKILTWIINSEPKYNTYNACSGKRISLLEIAQMVKRKMNSDMEIVILNEGWNKEYTGSNVRLLKEYNGDFLTIEKGIDIQIEWEKEHFEVGK